MEKANKTTIAYFIMIGISDIPELQTPIFLLVLLIYLTTLGGNTTILSLISTDCHLHTPMYFFLANLSVLDISCSTISLHKALITCITGDKLVSYTACLLQMYLFLSFTCVELLILTAMGFDRYVAICNPLHYHTVMTSRVYCILAVVCWIVGFIFIIPNFLKLFYFTCYTSQEINHFFCDLVPLMKLSCDDLYILQFYVIYGGALLVCLPPCLLTFMSYVFILRAILKIRSSSGRRKVFYTCTSHLTVISLLYGTLAYQYCRPIESIELVTNKFSSLFYTTALPILNPLIYSLKNKDVITALKRRLKVYPRQLLM
ncbi:olfactory receptor 6C74-like [Hyperolius riggenbachi]|uniref:olfactory receptor 6C74-like n=1 Tax=Hyperolius riggenbachi TaxID=752182 RepID=UPI0035A358D9